METKMTKKDWYEVIKGIVTESGAEQATEAVEFIDRQIELLDNKAAKAAERAANKKADGDELRANVLSVVTDELQTTDEITAAVSAMYSEEDEITRAKVTARLTQLVKAELITKDTVKVGSRKLTAYKTI